MAISLEDCVIALSGKFDETHGKQTILGIPRCFTLSPSVTWHISTSNLSLHRKAKIGALIRKNGGNHSTKISGEEDSWWVTHLITTAKHIEARVEKGETLSC